MLRHKVAIFAALIIATGVSAKASAGYSWKVFPSLDSCSLGNLDERGQFFFLTVTDRHKTQLLVHEPSWKFEHVAEVLIAAEVDQQSFKANARISALSDGALSLVWETDTDWTNAGTRPSQISLKPAGNTAILFSPDRASLESFHNCISGLSSNAAGPELGARPVMLTENPLSANDYEWARSQGFRGAVTARLTIDIVGRVANCQIVESTGSALLENKTCAIVQRRARFKPAVDINGASMTATYTRRFVWP